MLETEAGVPISAQLTTAYPRSRRAPGSAVGSRALQPHTDMTDTARIAHSRAESSLEAMVRAVRRPRAHNRRFPVPLCTPSKEIRSRNAEGRRTEVSMHIREKSLRYLKSNKRVTRTTGAEYLPRADTE